MLLSLRLLHITCKILRKMRILVFASHENCFPFGFHHWLHALNIQNTFFLVLSFSHTKWHTMWIKIVDISGLDSREGIGCVGNRTLGWQMQVYNQITTVLYKIVWFFSSMLKDFFETVYVYCRLEIVDMWGSWCGMIFCLLKLFFNINALGVCIMQFEVQKLMLVEFDAFPILVVVGLNPLWWFSFSL